jgi:hypothetical protein
MKTAQSTLTASIAGQNEVTIPFHIHRVKVIPHNSVRPDAQSDFSSDKTKSAVNTGGIYEHFCAD